MLCADSFLLCLFRYLPIIPMALVNGSDGIGTGEYAFDRVQRTETDATP